MENKIYNEQEKKVLINYFIKEGTNCKVEFKDYLVSFINAYGQKVYDKTPGRRVTSPLDELGNYEINAPKFLWGNENNDNLVTFLFSHPGFVMTSAKVKNIKKFKPDWHHVTNKGENFLFYTRRYRVKDLKALIEETQVDTSLVNHVGEVFYSHIFDNYKPVIKDTADWRIEEVRLIDIMNLVVEYNELMSQISLEKITELKEKFIDCTDILEKRLYELLSKQDKKFSYEEDKQNGTLPLNDHRGYMDKIFNYHLINKKLVMDENKEKIKKPKI